MQKKRRVLLVGWDGADWEHINPLLDAGKLPVLESLVNRGAMGNLATLQPALSPMLWSSVATGKQPWKHGVHGFMQPDRDLGGAKPWSSQSRKTKAIWNILSQSGLKVNVVNWWASFPAERVNGCIVSNMLHCVTRDQDKATFPRHAVHPDELSDDLACLSVEPHELTAQQILPFVPGGKEIDQDNDNRLSILASHLAEMLTTHNISTALMEETDWDFMAVYYTAIDHFCHSFVPYHPPKLPWITEEDFEKYRHVIEGVYRFSDMTLGRLVELAGPDATIILCSDHGFQSGSLRLMTTPNEPAGPAYWHRKYGILVAAGPGIKQDARVYGATLLDITPTLLELFGLPVGKDMDGRILTEIFEARNATPVKAIPSWDLVESDQDGVIKESIVSDEKEAAELVKQFVALGYVDDVGDSKSDQYTSAETEADFNLARNLLWCRQFRKAAALFLDLMKRFPWEDRFIVHLARSLIAADLPAAAKSLLEHAYDTASTTNRQALCLWAESLIAVGDRDVCLDVLTRLERHESNTLGVQLLIGTCYLRLRKLKESQRVFEQVIQLHEENAEALLGLSTVHLGLRNDELAAEYALASLALVYNQVRAHLNLGIALARSKDFQRASRRSSRPFESLLNPAVPIAIYGLCMRDHWQILLRPKSIYFG